MPSVAMLMLMSAQSSCSVFTFTLDTSYVRLPITAVLAVFTRA